MPENRRKVEERLSVLEVRLEQYGAGLEDVQDEQADLRGVVVNGFRSIAAAAQRASEG